MDSRISRTKLLAAALASALFAFLLFASPGTGHLYINTTPSLPEGLYITTDSIPVKGDIVVFDAPPEIAGIADARGWKPAGIPFMKKIGATAGETYEIREEDGTLQFYIGTEYIGRVYEKDSQGRPMPLRIGKFDVPEGHFLPIAENEKSFDGRYYGPIPRKCIRSSAKPLLVIEF